MLMCYHQTNFPKTRNSGVEESYVDLASCSRRSQKNTSILLSILPKIGIQFL